MCFIDSNMFLYTLYSVSLCFVLFFKNFSYSFCFFFEDFLMSFVIQGLNCLGGFNFTLIFGNHSLYNERNISRNLLYASLTFRKILILCQSILRHFCLNLPIDWSEILRLKMYCSVLSASILFFVAKMIRKWSEICFYNSSLNFYIAHDSICKYVINCSSSVPCDTCRFVYRRDHSKS